MEPSSALAFGIIVAAAIVLVLVFGVVYSVALPDYSIYSMAHSAAKQKLSFGEGMYMSIGTQSLLGLGDLAPVSRQAKAAVSIQSACTLAWFLALGALTIQAK